MRDAIELEWAGLPSVAIVHEAVAVAAVTVARMSGASAVPRVVLGRPFGPEARWSDDEIDAIAELVTPQVVAALTVPAEVRVSEAAS